MNNKPELPVLHIEQLEPYQNSPEEPVSNEETLQCMIDTLEKFGLLLAKSVRKLINLHCQIISTF